MKVGIGYCNDKNAFHSGRNVAQNAIEKGNINRYDFVFAFCNNQVDHNDFFLGMQSILGNKVPIVGGSAIGIITNEYLSYKNYPAGAAVIQSDNVTFRVSVAGQLDKDEKTAGIKLAKKLLSNVNDMLLLIFYDSIKSKESNMTPILNASSPLVEGIEKELQKYIPIIGAGLVGDYSLSPTKQFCGSYVSDQTVVGTLLSGDFKIYFRIMHGCNPMDGIYHTITKMEGPFIYELDGKPIIDIIDDLYGSQDWRHEQPVSLLTIGKNHGKKYEEPKESNYVNRLITGILPDGKGIAIFEPDFEQGTEIQFMLRDTAQMIESARNNSAVLMEQIKQDGTRALFAMYIDCAGRAADYSYTTMEEASEIQKICNHYDIPLLGFYSGVEVAPLLKKSRGLDWTGVLLVLAR